MKRGNHLDIKTSAKNLVKLKGYWKVILFNRLQKKECRHSLNSKIQCDDLFIVTSCTNPFDSECFINHNASHALFHRYQELITTFESIRYYYPSALIVSLENSKLTEDLDKSLRESVDYYRNYSSDSFIKFSRKFSNKGVPWIAKLLKFFYEEGASIEAMRIHFLCGRYCLVNPIKIDINSSGIHFKYYRESDNVSTRYFISQNVTANSIYKIFALMVKPVIFGKSVEDIIFRNNEASIFFYKRLGLIGMVNGLIKIEE